MANKIKELRKSKKLSGEALGKLIGVERAMMSKLERGTAKLTQDYIDKLCAALDVTSDQLLGRASAPNLHNKIEISSHSRQVNHDMVSSIGHQLIPVYGPAGAGSNDRIYHSDGNIIGWDKMPDALIGVKGAFKVLIRGSSMEERYFDGEKAEIHPYKPCIPGKDCVIVLDEDGDMLIKRYLGETATEYKVAQLNPKKTFSIKKSTVRAIYYVIGRSE